MTNFSRNSRGLGRNSIRLPPDYKSSVALSANLFGEMKALSLLPTDMREVLGGYGCNRSANVNK
jgi:hypothetical protein